MSLKRVLRCGNANCGLTTQFVTDEIRGEIVCKSCGRVAVTQLMNEAEEKINYAESETNHSRTQAVDNYTESMGTTLTGDDSLARLTKARDNRVKALLDAKKSIQHFGGILNMNSKTCENAQEIFKKYIETGKHKPKGANSEASILGILFISARQTEAPAELKQMSHVTGVDQKLIRTAVNKLLKAGFHANSTSAPDLISRYGDALHLPASLITLAGDIAKGASKYLEGKYPSTVAAASIYMAVEKAGNGTRLEDIAKAASITSSTVTAAYKEIVGKDDLWPEDYEKLLAAAKQAKKGK